MSLQCLPPEILRHILRLLGSAFFRQDVRRLIVSKWWHEFARPVFLEDLHLHTESIEGFVIASKRVALVPSIRNHVKTVRLSLDGFGDWPLKQSGLSDVELSENALHVANAWTAKLHCNLAAVASILQQCPRLDSFSIEARPEYHDPNLGLQRRDYLTAYSVTSLMSNHHLTCLEIDTAGTHLIDQDGTPKVHVCNTISAMLPTLRRLRCRMSSICPHIFDLPKDATLRRLEDVVINLSLSEVSGSDTSYRYPRRCQKTPGDSFLQLKGDIELRATKLAHTMHNSPIVRIISHTFPGLYMHSFDAAIGRTMVLDAAAPWDADGKEVEEVEEGSEPEGLIDSDSSSEENFITL